MNKITIAFIFALYGFLSFSQEVKPGGQYFPFAHSGYPPTAIDTTIIADPVTPLMGTEAAIYADAIPRIPFKVFPNPALEKIYVRLGNTKSDKIKIRLRNSKGELLSSEEQKIPPDKIIELNAKLARGIYFISVTDQNYSVTKKIIIE
jgi:hypothetical protein